MSDPIYDLVMALHVLAAVVGFGALGTTGVAAGRVRASADPRLDPAIARYFRPGRNWAARAIVLVPVLGGVMIGLGHGRDARFAWPWIGLLLWSAATGLAAAVIWPSERAIQRALDGGPASALAREARRIERAATATSVLFLAALVVMIWQPA